MVALGGTLKRNGKAVIVADRKQNIGGPETIDARRNAFCTALENAGFEIVDESFLTNRMVPGFTVMWGMKRNSNLLIRCHQQGVPILIMENGFLGRPVHWMTDRPKPPEGGYVQLSWDHIANIPPGPRPEDRLKMLVDLIGPIAPERRDNGYLLICGQVPDDAQHMQGPIALRTWLEGAAKSCLQFHQYARVIYRPHPMKKNFVIRSCGTGKFEIQDVEKTSLDEAFAGAREIVTYNSNAGVEAMVAGIRVKCHPLAHYSVHANGSFAARRAYLARLAYMQWTISELADGTALAQALANFEAQYRHPFHP